MKRWCIIERIFRMIKWNSKTQLSSFSNNLMATRVNWPIPHNTQSKILSFYQSYQMLSPFRAFQKNILAQQATTVTLNQEQWSESTHFSNLCWEGLEITSELDLMLTTTRSTIIAGQISITYRMYRSSWAKILCYPTNFAANKTQSRWLPYCSRNPRKRISSKENLKMRGSSLKASSKKTVPILEINSLETLSLSIFGAQFSLMIVQNYASSVFAR